MSRSDSPNRRKANKLAQDGPKIPRCPVTSKYSYRSKKRALTALNHAKPLGSPARYVYKCRHCSGWHLTKQPPRTKET